MAVAFLTGCDGEQKAEVALRRACLSKLGMAYIAFANEKNAAPKDVEELVGYMKSASDDETTTEAIKRLRDGDIVMFWNAKLSDDGDANDQHVLGFEAAVPRGGGYIVMGGGFVDLVSAKKFTGMSEIPRAE